MVLATTPLGYLHTFGLEISFLMVPVALGAILLGPGAGAVLGLSLIHICFRTMYGNGSLLSPMYSKLFLLMQYRLRHLFPILLADLRRRISRKCKKRDKCSGSLFRHLCTGKI